MNWLAKTDEEIKAYIMKLSEYEADGYNLTGLRYAKECLLAFPEKARTAFELMDFAAKVWGEVDYNNRPLTHIGLFLFNAANSVAQFVANQLQGLETDRALWIARLSDKKANTKFIHSMLENINQNITTLQTALKEYKNTPMNNTDLKTEKDRILSDLAIIKRVVNLKRNDLNAIEEVLIDLSDLGFVLDGCRVVIQTAGGAFKFNPMHIDRIEMQVKLLYPSDLNVDVPSSVAFYIPEFLENYEDALHNLREAQQSGNEGLISLFRAELDKVIERKKDLLLYV